MREFEKPNRFAGFTPLLFLAAVLPASGLGLLVPAYFYPSGPGATRWSQMNQAAARVPLIAILNPDSVRARAWTRTTQVS